MSNLTVGQVIGIDLSKIQPDAFVHHMFKFPPRAELKDSVAYRRICVFERPEILKALGLWVKILGI